MNEWPIRYEKVIRYPDYSYPCVTSYPRYTCIQECVPLCRPCNHVACSAAGAQIILNKKGEPIDVKPIPISKSSVKISRGKSKGRRKGKKSGESGESSESGSESFSEYSDEGKSSSDYKSSSKKKKSKSKGRRESRDERKSGRRGGSRGNGGGGEGGGGSNITDYIKDGKEVVDNVQGISDTVNQTATNLRDLPGRCTIL